MIVAVKILGTLKVNKNDNPIQINNVHREKMKKIWQDKKIHGQIMKNKDDVD